MIITSGKILRRLNESDNNDVAVHNGLLYTTIRGTRTDDVQIYSTKTWQQTSVIDIPCTGRGHWHTLCVNEQCMFVSCFKKDRIYKMSLDGKIIATHCKRGNRIGGFKGPYTCMCDSDNLLVADQWNQHL